MMKNITGNPSNIFLVRLLQSNFGVDNLPKICYTLITKGKEKEIKK